MQQADEVQPFFQISYKRPLSKIPTWTQPYQQEPHKMDTCYPFYASVMARYSGGRGQAGLKVAEDGSEAPLQELVKNGF